MKNIPNQIYLQLGFEPDEFSEDDFKNCTEISWNDERIFDSDIEYVLTDVGVKYAIWYRNTSHRDLVKLLGKDYTIEDTLKYYLEHFKV